MDGSRRREDVFWLDAWICAERSDIVDLLLHVRFILSRAACFVLLLVVVVLLLVVVVEVSRIVS